MRIMRTTARAAAVALPATEGVAVSAATAAAGDGSGSPSGGIAPLLEGEGSDKVAPTEVDWGVAPPDVSPVGALERADQGIWG